MTNVWCLIDLAAEVMCVPLFALARAARVLVRLSQVIVQAIESLLPLPPVRLHPLGGCAHRAGLEPAWPPLRVAALGYEAGALQHLQVLRHRGEAHVEGRGELGDGRLAGDEPAENGAAG